MIALQISTHARKYLKRVKDQVLAQKLYDGLRFIQVHGECGQQKRGDLAGVYCIDIYHVGTNYEIAYDFTDATQSTVRILLIGTRENFYRELRKRRH